jgi:pyruvate kinase
VADLQGPKVRIGDLVTQTLQLEDGALWRLDTLARPGDARRVGVSTPAILHGASPGDPVILGDGSIELIVRRVSNDHLDAEVVHGGTVASHSGLFLPRARLRPRLLGPRDRRDLALALEEGADYVALSFVSSASDLIGVRRRIRAAGYPDVGLIAKIERREALENIDAIAEVADGIMVARGDLGIEVPLERLAIEQKRLIERANAAHKVVIVATQMLLSMVSAPRPTRAEATDVANAVLDGADAVMLSEESAIGHFPFEAVGWLDRICRATEEASERGELAIRKPGTSDSVPGEAVAEAAVRLARSTRAGAIVTPTHSGRTARLVAGQRPDVPVIALSAVAATRRALALTWGVTAHRAPRHLTLLELRTYSQRLVARLPAISPGRPIVLTAGYPLEGRPTNLVTVLEPQDPAPRRDRRSKDRARGGGRRERAR